MDLIKNIEMDIENMVDTPIIMEKIRTEIRKHEDKLALAIKPFLEALEVNDSDTQGMSLPDSYIIWTASGCWSADADITLGDLRNLAAIKGETK